MTTLSPFQKVKIFSLTWLLCSFCFLGIAYAVNITASLLTDFVGTPPQPGTILEQSTDSAARIFKYEENSIFATAIRDVNPESHYHLFGAGLLAGGDGEGVVFTVGGMNPTLQFDVLSLDIAALDLELNSGETVNAFLTPFFGSTIGSNPGTGLAITNTGFIDFDPNHWSGVTHFIAAYDTPRPGSGVGVTMKNLQVNAVPEPSTIGLFGTGLAGLWWLRRRKHQQ